MFVAGDVVIAASPRNPRHIVCKRVLGLEGDTVRVPVTSRDDARTVKVRFCVSVQSKFLPVYTELEVVGDLATWHGCQRTPHAVPATL